MGGSTKQQQSAALRRQLAVLWQLVLHPRGMTYAQLQAATGVPKATFHRYLACFSEAELLIDRELVGGETRYCLLAAREGSLAISDLQLHALTVARQTLSALDGAQIVRALDELIKLAKRGRSPLRGGTIRIRASRAAAPAHLAVIDQALSQRKRLILHYRGRADDVAQVRRVDPVALRHAGESVYLQAFDCARGALRTFKLDRIVTVEMTRERAANHRLFDEGLRHAVKAWMSDPTDIVVRIHAEAARYASEYPVIDDQVVEAHANGSLLVRARVNGIVEATRWVLGWGESAEAMEPPSLRDAVARQVLGAALQYRNAGAHLASVRDNSTRTDDEKPARKASLKKSQVP